MAKVKDIEHKGKLYRIIGEGTSLAHPEGAVVAMFEIGRPGGPREVLRPDEYLEDSEIEQKMSEAEIYIRGT